jgi:hypothetical protein
MKSDKCALSCSWVSYEEAFDGGFLDGSVHAFDLTIGPGMVRLGEAVFDSLDMAGPIEGMAAEAGGWPLAILRKVGELDSVVGEHGVDTVRNDCDECFQEGGSSSHISLFHQCDHSELGSSIHSMSLKGETGASVCLVS